jgi:uracil-DNA glycosylase
MVDRISPQLPKTFNGLVVIGESPGKTELELGFPFVGKSGKLLDTVLDAVGIVREDCHVTNVFLSRPENDKIDKFFRPAIEGDSEFIEHYGLYRNRVVKTDHRFDLERLDQELESINPKIILMLGATALWRISRTNGITEHRGEWVFNEKGIAAIASWHPSAVLRDRNNKLPQFVADLKQVSDVLKSL